MGWSGGVLLFCPFFPQRPQTWRPNELTFHSNIIDRLSLAAAARTAKSGFLFGLAYGGVQDLLGIFRGRPIGYVEFIRGRGSKDGHLQRRLIDGM